MKNKPVYFWKLGTFERILSVAVIILFCAIVTAPIVIGILLAFNFR